jgi:serine/threonine-protein kinase HipA
MKLDVYVNGKLVGELEQADLASYVFRYLPGVGDEHMVSLLMPPSEKSVWEYRFLHPVFQVSLPEGALRNVLTRTFAKEFGTFGDTELLSVIGSHLVGRIQVVAAGRKLEKDAPAENLRELLGETSEEMLDHYLGVHARFSGVSGGFTKFLAKSASETNDSGRATLTFDHWIVKADDEDHPNLVLNEYFCLLVCRQMGLPTPQFELSEDGRRMAIRRFDVREDGSHLGFEDMCAMLGRNASDKFGASVESMIKRINEFCSPLSQVRASLDQFYAQYLACMALRNGDAHAKNFGLTYTNFDDVRLSPVYDMVTMSAYAPPTQDGDTADRPALTFGGVQRWFDEKARAALAARCTVSPRRQQQIAQEITAAISSVSLDVLARAEADEKFRPMGKRMLQLWSHGVRLHNTHVAGELMALAEQLHTDQPVYVQRPRVRL